MEDIAELTAENVEERAGPGSSGKNAEVGEPETSRVSVEEREAVRIARPVRA